MQHTLICVSLEGVLRVGPNGSKNYRFKELIVLNQVVSVAELSISL